MLWALVGAVTFIVVMYYFGLNPNFYEKAVFVKGDVATAPGLRQLLCALRAMLLSAVNTL